MKSFKSKKLKLSIPYNAELTVLVSVSIDSLSFSDLNKFTKMSLILFMILGKVEIIAVIYLIRRLIFRE